jgi:porin
VNAGRGRALLLLLLSAARLGMPESAHAAERSTLLGDPRGWRSRAADAGLSVQLFANLYPSWKVRGGASDDGGELGHSASYDLIAYADLGELVGMRGSSLLLRVKGQYDRSVNGDVGALSDPIDDADFDEPVYVDELWAQQSFLGGRLRLRAGLLEQQTVFDRNAYANSEDLQFLNSFLDNGLVPLPNGLGVDLVAAPAPWLELAAGVVDADNRQGRSGFDTAFDDFDSLTVHAEATVRARLRGPRGELPGSYRLGVYRDGRERVRFGTTQAERGAWGAYLSFDQLVFRESGGGGGDGPPEGLGLFARAGWADPEVSAVEWLWSLGVSYRGIVPARGDDTLGLGMYQAIASPRFRAASDPAFDRETGFELYYALALRRWLVITPDLQWILDPGPSGAGRNALVATLRVRLTF